MSQSSQTSEVASQMVVERKLTSPPPPKPDGAKLQQVLQTISTFVVFVNTWGVLNTFGVFQVYYEKVLLKDQSSSSIAWVSTICALLLLAGGLITGPLYDQGYYRSLIFGGSLLQVLGFMMISISKEYYQILLSQGICIGIGAGMLFTPSVAAAAATFQNPATRAKVVGFLACGGGIGGIIYPIVFRYLITRVGFPWTVRTIGFIVLVTYCVAYLDLLSGPRKGLMVRRIYDASAFRDGPFMSLCVSGASGALAYYIPLLFLPAISELTIPGVDSSMGFDLLAILNGATAFGRILCGFMAAQFGAIETCLGATFFGAIVLFCWTAATSLSGVIVWTVFWGIVSGALVALPPAIIPYLCPSLSVIGTRSGMYWTFCGLGMLVGPPIGSAIVELRVASTNWWHLYVFAGFVMLGSCLAGIWPCVAIRKQRTNVVKSEKDDSGSGKSRGDV